MDNWLMVVINDGTIMDNNGTMGNNGICLINGSFKVDEY
jgi:hypothetical protein